MAVTLLKASELVKILTDSNLMDRQTLAALEEESLRLKKPLEDLLVEKKLVSRREMALLFSEYLGIPYSPLETTVIETTVLFLFPPEYLKKKELIPLRLEGNMLEMVMANPRDMATIDEIKLLTGYKVIPRFALRQEIMEKIASLPKAVKTTEAVRAAAKMESALFVPGFPVEQDTQAIIRVVDSLLMDAIEKRASDIHLEPQEKELKVRYRVDGVLHEITTIPKNIESAIISQIKVRAKLNIAEKRRSQDGRFTFSYQKKDYDQRVSVMATLWGEKVVIRILRPSELFLGFNQLGLQDDDYERFKSLIQAPHGILLVTGPTGSGKTTSLYAAISEINDPTRNIVTVEDPIELPMEGINQTQILPQIDLTFANSLRTILRQDPDVILIGEIRDAETLSAAIHASLTGHLVLSTMHTNDTASTITRLVEMGVAPHLITTTLIGVIAQRLARIICPYCKTETPSTKEELEYLELKDKEPRILYKGKGCDRCFMTGYQGRTAIFELLILTQPIKEAIAAGKPSYEIHRIARQVGMKSMFEDGRTKVFQGITTAAELKRVLGSRKEEMHG